MRRRQASGIARILVTSGIVASLSMASTLASAQVVTCDETVVMPPGGFAVNNLSGINPQTPIIRLEFARFGNAYFAQVSNDPSFPPDDPNLGVLTAYIPLGYGELNATDWSLSPGYGDKRVYVRFVNSCKLNPNPVEPLVIELTYWPDFCNQPITPPPGGFKVQLAGSSPVSSPDIQLTFVGGNANKVRVSNDNFATSRTIDIGYGSISPHAWTLPGYGNWIVSAEFLNDCDAMPSAPAVVAVSYPNPACNVPINPNGLMLTSQGPVNVKLGRPVVLVPHGNNAVWARISNSNTFTNSTWFRISENPTITWTLPFGTGSKTVWAQYWNECKTARAPINYSLSFAVSR